MKFVGNFSAFFTLKTAEKYVIIDNDIHFH